MLGGNLADALGARPHAAMNIQEVKSEKGIIAWLVEDHTVEIDSAVPRHPSRYRRWPASSRRCWRASP
ncbi:MAG: hypothetical protein E5V40_32160, partial [Mesorhizobium sp.]